MPKFARGGDNAAEAAKSMMPSFSKLRFFSLAENDQKIVRFLHESPEWVYVMQHTGVPTKNPPANNEGAWPETMPAICRYDKAFKGQFTDCYICDSGITDKWGKPCKPSIRVWMLCCIREPVMEEGKVAGYRDQIIELPVFENGKPVEGKTIKDRDIQIVNMGMKNFFTGLNGIYGVYGSNCDRDFVVKRIGTGKDSNYPIMPLDKIAGCEPGTEWWDKYAKSIRAQEIDLDRIIDERASDEYFARFFDPSKTAPARSSDGASASAAPPPPSADVDADRVAAMRERVRSQTAAAAAPVPVAAGSGPKNFD